MPAWNACSTSLAVLLPAFANAESTMLQSRPSGLSVWY